MEYEEVPGTDGLIETYCRRHREQLVHVNGLKSIPMRIKISLIMQIRKKQRDVVRTGGLRDGKGEPCCDGGNRQGHVISSTVLRFTCQTNS